MWDFKLYDVNYKFFYQQKLPEHKIFKKTWSKVASKFVKTFLPSWLIMGMDHDKGKQHQWDMKPPIADF